MLSSALPTKISIPFASSGTKNVISNTSQIGIVAGAASYPDGFPPLTFTPIAAGGVPPFGADFNGIANAITKQLQWMNAGGSYVYDATFATAIGGYPKGAMLERSTLDGFWLNGTDNNTSNPDASGAGWVNPFAGRLLNTQIFQYAGNFTYIPTSGTRFIDVEILGAGGAGGGAVSTASGSYTSGGAGGSAGSYCRGVMTTGFLGATVTIGAGGIGSTGSVGSSGGSSSFGSALSAPGGPGGYCIPNTVIGTGIYIATNAPSPLSSGGYVSTNGQPGGSFTALVKDTFTSGVGGPSVFGSGGQSKSTVDSAGVYGINGNNGNTPGSGGSGAGALSASPGAFKGGNGVNGVCIIREYA